MPMWALVGLTGDEFAKALKNAAPAGPYVAGASRSGSGETREKAFGEVVRVPRKRSAELESGERRARKGAQWRRM